MTYLLIYLSIGVITAIYTYYKDFRHYDRSLKELVKYILLTILLWPNTLTVIVLTNSMAERITNKKK